MASTSTRTIILREQQAVYDGMREDFEAMGTGGRYCREQKDYALGLSDEYGVRATARILQLPRRTLQRWCREQGRYVPPVSGMGLHVGGQTAETARVLAAQRVLLRPGTWTQCRHLKSGRTWPRGRGQGSLPPP